MYKLDSNLKYLIEMCQPIGKLKETHSKGEKKTNYKD